MQEDDGEDELPEPAPAADGDDTADGEQDGIARASPARTIRLGYARPGTERPAMSLVTIATFAQSWEAHLAAGKLESAGIPAVLADENIVGIGGGIYTGLAGGIKLQVPQQDIQRALAELPERVRVRQMECPRCKSMQTREIDFTPGVKALFLVLLGLPYLFVGKPWVCLDCQYAWKPAAGAAAGGETDVSAHQ